MSIDLPKRGFKLRVRRGHVFYSSSRMTKCWFSIGSRDHVRLTCCKQQMNKGGKFLVLSTGLII